MTRTGQALLRRISRINRAFELVAPGDRIMVACSGGKDSWALLHLLRAYRDVVPFSFSIVAMNLDQGHPGFPVERLREHFEAEGFEYHIEYADTHRVVVERTEPGKIYCSLCSRMRRGILHRVAERLGANKIALGHHRDDAIETLMLNMMYAGQLKAMPPLLPPGEDEDRSAIAVIRPLLWCGEDEIADYAAQTGAPIVPCNLCGSQPQAQRQAVKRWLTELERDNPRLRANLLASLANVRPSHLHDRELQGRGAASRSDLVLLRH